MLALGFAVLWAVSFVGADWVAGRVPWRIAVRLSFEPLPFVPELVWLYVTLNLVLLCVPFVLQRVEALAACFLSMVLATAAATVVFVSLPVDPIVPIGELPDGWTARAFRFADSVNLDRNLLPSLHVALAALGAVALGSGASTVLRLALGVWVIGVAASTVLLHQHYVIDALAGAVLALCSWAVTQKVMIPRGWARALAVDLYCLDNMIRFSRRHHRYLTIGVSVLGASVFRWRRRRLLRTGYCLLQAIDDLLDGDRPCDGEPLDLVDRLGGQIRGRTLADDPLSVVAQSFVSDLEARGGPSALEAALALIDQMRFDRVRRRNGLVLDACALAAHHRRTFELSLDLMLLAGDCELRTRDVEELADVLGWCSTLRDLGEDLDGGLVNLPREVVDGIVRPADRPDRSWAGDPVVLAWLEEGRKQALVKLDRVDHSLSMLRGKRGHRVLVRFTRSVRRYARRPIVLDATARRRSGPVKNGEATASPPRR